jgi:hypothetical protein
MSKKCRFCGVPSEWYECTSCHRIYTYLLNLYRYSDKALNQKEVEYKEKLVMIEATRSISDMKDRVNYVKHNCRNS